MLCRSPYLCSLTQHVLQDNWAVQAVDFAVLHKSPTEIQLLKDVPMCCNVLIADLLSDGEGTRNEMTKHLLLSVNGVSLA